MRDILEDVRRWRNSGEQIALATVIQTWGSSPRQEGAKMAITRNGDFSGSVSGGCVESAVIKAGMEVLKDGTPQLLHYGVTDETAWGVGLACGGSLDVFVERMDPVEFDFLDRLLVEERPVASVTVIDGPAEYLGSKLVLDLEDSTRQYGMAELADSATRTVERPADLRGRRSRSLWREAERPAGLGGRSSPRRFQRPRAPQVLAGGEQPSVAELQLAGHAVQAFIDHIPPPPTLIVIGGVQIAIALSQLARTMGFRTIIVDPRRAFAKEERFPGVDRVLQAWPAEAFAELPLTPSTAVVTLTHDPKIDEPALSLALPSPAFYVGALGSKRTQSKRRQRLSKLGISDSDLNRLHGPVGLELGADTPEDIALSIMAQIVSVRNNHRS